MRERERERERENKCDVKIPSYRERKEEKGSKGGKRT